MSIFVISGRIDCPNFTHAVHVAEYLKKNLPDFDFKQNAKYDEADWESCLDEINTSKGWHIYESPLIWKEIARSGGKAYLIGGLSEFWEYCYDYYGFESTISKEDLNGLLADKLQIQQDAEKNKTITIISITGASNLMIEFLLLELQNVVNLKNQDQAIFRLFDKDLQYDLEKGEFLIEVAEQMQILMHENVKNVLIVSSLSEAIDNCDLLLVMDDFSRNEDEITTDWLRRCALSMRTLAEEIQDYAKRTLRVVLSHLGPTCFNVSILLEFCTNIRLANIVAVTADEGLNFLQTASDETKIPVEDMGCPPVWGFSGVSSFVDVNNVVVRAEVCRPFTRAYKLKDGSVLSKGKITRELRLLSYALESEESVLRSVADKKRKQEQLLKRPSLLPKVRATISLLKLWFMEEPGDEVISLGICSNGSFGLPIGVCFSQPAILNERYVWEPFTNYPMDSTAKLKLRKIMPEVQNILKEFNLGQKRKDSTSLL